MGARGEIVKQQIHNATGKGKTRSRYVYSESAVARRFRVLEIGERQKMPSQSSIMQQSQWTYTWNIRHRKSYLGKRRWEERRTLFQHQILLFQLGCPTPLQELASTLIIRLTSSSLPETSFQYLLNPHSYTRGHLGLCPFFIVSRDLLCPLSQLLGVPLLILINIHGALQIINSRILLIQSVYRYRCIKYQISY